MNQRFQFSLARLFLATALIAVAACLAKAFYDAIPPQPWQLVLPISACASFGAAVGSIASSQLRTLITGFLVGAIASSVVIVLLLAHAMFMDYIFRPILQNG
jgi:hypothetical protein